MSQVCKPMPASPRIKNPPSSPMTEGVVQCKWGLQDGWPETASLTSSGCNSDDFDSVKRSFKRHLIIQAPPRTSQRNINKKENKFFHILPSVPSFFDKSTGCDHSRCSPFFNRWVCPFSTFYFFGIFVVFFSLSFSNSHFILPRTVVPLSAFR